MHSDVELVRALHTVRLETTDRRANRPSKASRRGRRRRWWPAALLTTFRVSHIPGSEVRRWTGGSATQAKQWLSPTRRSA